MWKFPDPLRFRPMQIHESEQTRGDVGEKSKLGLEGLSIPMNARSEPLYQSPRHND